HRGDLPLAKRIIKGVVDGLGRYPETSDGVAVDFDHHPWRRGLEISRYVLQLWQRSELVQHDRSPLEKLSDIRVLQRVLVLSLGDSSPDLHILASLTE